MKTMKKVEQGKGTTDYLMPLGYLFSFLRSGPARAFRPLGWPPDPLGGPQNLIGLLPHPPIGLSDPLTALSTIYLASQTLQLAS